MKRCAWCEENERLRKYHDEEWGVPLHDDRRLFEYLVMEVMQCGLNWNMMLMKREIFRACFEDFDYDLIAEYGDDKVEAIMGTPGMIRSPRKIRAVIHNARCYQQIRREYGTFDRYLWAYTEGKTLVIQSHKESWPAKNSLSDRISADLKKRGFKYLGSITVYAHLQSCGMINDHRRECFRYREINRAYAVEFRETDY